MLIFVSNFEFKRVSIMSSRILKVRQSQNDFSSQKSNKQIILYYYETLGRLVFVRFFWRNWRHQKDISKLPDRFGKKK